jgi:hypothetical protein
MSDLHWEKIIWASEEVARLLAREGYAAEHDWIVRQWRTEALGLRDRAGKAVGDVPQPWQKILDVPWLSQLGRGAEYAVGDCGPACVAMLLRWRGTAGVAVDDVARATGRPAGFVSAHVLDLIGAARRWGLGLWWAKGLALADLRREIEAGYPAIALVHYPSLPARVRYDKSYQECHFVVVMGWTDDAVLYHDPYWPKVGQGATIRLTHQEFAYAWGRNSLRGNSNFQALRVVRK